MNENRLQNVMRYLPPPVQTALRHMPPEMLQQIQEIRLRAERPLGVCLCGKEHFLTESGVLKALAGQGIRTTQKTVEQTFQAVCEYSVYRYTRKICDGFVTIAGGNRVGIAGSAVYREGTFSQVRYISGLNFRIAHAVTGCAQNLYGQTCATVPHSILLVGAVGSGKTIMLRDLCHLIGNKHRVTLVDERSEIAAMHHGVPRYPVGMRTDVCVEGLLTALRVLTPEVLICDEIGTDADAEAILLVRGCGVPVIAFAHWTSWEDLEKRTTLRRLLEADVFSYASFLRVDQQGVIEDLRRIDHSMEKPSAL